MAPPIVREVEDLCKSLCSLMKGLKDSRNTEDVHITRIGFQLWWNLLHFNIIGGNVCVCVCVCVCVWVGVRVCACGYVCVWVGV